MKFRNQTIADSERVNESTYVMAALRPVTVDRGLVVTTASPSPHTFVQRFQTLVSERQVLLAY